jgi:hypothetical protein
MSVRNIQDKIKTAKKFSLKNFVITFSSLASREQVYLL